MISIIAAAARNGVIGSGGRIPWNIPEDMAYFRRITYGGAVIMGRRTFEEIGKPLKGRLNIIVSSKRKFEGEDVLTAGSLRIAVELAKRSGRENIFLCGGASIYREGLDIAERIYLTEVDGEYEGDTFFPDFSRKGFELVSSERFEEAGVTFDIYDKKKRLT